MHGNDTQLLDSRFGALAYSGDGLSMKGVWGFCSVVTADCFYSAFPIEEHKMASWLFGKETGSFSTRYGWEGTTQGKGSTGFFYLLFMKRAFRWSSLCCCFGLLGK